MQGIKFTEAEKDLIVNLIVEALAPHPSPEERTKINASQAGQILTKVFTHTE